MVLLMTVLWWRCRWGRSEVTPSLPGREGSTWPSQDFLTPNHPSESSGFSHPSLQCCGEGQETQGQSPCIRLHPVPPPCTPQGTSWSSVRRSGGLPLLGRVHTQCKAFLPQISRKAPVLVMFHGGSFYMGTKSHSKPTYLMDEDIVVVLANYRLGILGFLTFETKDLAGNQGLKDQLMVLRWVKQNIPSFGGDPDRVTIIGCSAGGASVHSHILSPQSKGLFHRAISTSGSMYNPWALSPPGLARTNAQKLMTLIGCPTEPSKAIPCVMEKDAHFIVQQTAVFIKDSSGMLIFSPSLEAPGSGGFLEAPVSKWDQNPVPLVYILSSAEGLVITKNLNLTAGASEQALDMFSAMAPIFLNYWASASRPDAVTKKVKEYYLPGNMDNQKDVLFNLTCMFSDALFNHGVLKAANKHKGDVYFLWFDYVPPELSEYNLKLGASHCGESCFMWEQPGEIPVPITSEKYIELSKAIVKSIAHFLENGTVNVPGSNITWTKWNSEDQNYLQLDRNGVFSMKSGLLQDRYRFWDTLGHQDKF